MSSNTMVPSRTSSRAPKRNNKYVHSDDDEDDASDALTTKKSTKKRKSNNSSLASGTTNKKSCINEQEEKEKNIALYNATPSNITAAAGEIGYVFRKQFDKKWYKGKVVEIRIGAKGGLDRRCVYEDGDDEDLSVANIKSLVALDTPRNNNNNNRTATSMLMEIGTSRTSSVNTMGDDGSIVNDGDEGSIVDGDTIKDGGGGKGRGNNVRTSPPKTNNNKSIDTVNKAGGEESGGDIFDTTLKDGGSDSESEDRGVSTTKDSSDMCADITGGGKSVDLEIVVETCLLAPPAPTKLRGTSGRTEWGEDIKKDVAVQHGWVKLDPKGTFYDCTLCDMRIKARRPYDPDHYTGKTAHRERDKHKLKVEAKLFNLKREKQRIAKGKQPDKTLVDKAWAQSSLIGFCRKRTTTTASTSTSTSTSTSISISTSTSTSTSTTTTTSATSSATSRASSDIAGQSASTLASIAKGCTGIIPLKHCRAVGSKLDLTLVQKYGRLDPKSDYELKEIGEGTLVYNLYHDECTGVGIHLVSGKQGGIRCKSCTDFWTKRSSKITKSMKGRIGNLKRAESLLLVPRLTPDDAKSMRDFTRTGDQVLNDHAGRRLKEMVNERLKFYQIVTEIPACNDKVQSSETSSSLVVTKNVDPFLYDFVQMFTSNPSMRNSLLCALMQVYVTKLKGHKNPKLPEKAMNFFIACDSMSRKTFDFLSGNMLGPCLRTIQRMNATVRQPSIICISTSDLEKRLTDHLKTLPDYDKVTKAIAIGFDGTKVPAVLTLSTSTRSIIGGVYPNHMIDISGKTKEEVKDMLDPSSDIERAKEIKVAVVTIQNAGVGHSPYFVLAGHPQSINMPSDFNKRITSVVSSLCKRDGTASLVCVAADGVGCDARFIQGELVSFIRGDTNHVAVVDTNHNGKNFRYQGIGGSCVVIMGNHVLDPALLYLGGVAVELWRVKDWASDLVLLRLASENTVAKVATLVNEEVGSVAVLCVTLYFLRLKLFAVNTKKASYRDRICFLWASTIWLTSFEWKSPLGTNQSNMTINRRNLITETLGLVFAMARDDVSKPRYLTTECNEHTFGGWRGERREATTQECTEIEEKRRNRIRAIFASNLKVSRDPQKGYSATFDTFVEAAQPAPGVTGGPVNVNGGGVAAVDLLWEEVKPIVNAISEKMAVLLDRFAVSPGARSCLCRQFVDVSDLLAVYMSTLPSDNGVDDIQVEEEDNTPAVEEEDNTPATIDSNGNGVGVDMAALQDLLSEVDERDDLTQDVEDEDNGDEDTVDIDADAILFAEEGESGSATASRKFRTLLMSSTKDDLVAASKEGMKSLQMKRNETGSTTGDRKFSSLIGRWYSDADGDGSGSNVANNGSEGDKTIERNTRIKVTIKEGKGAASISAKEDFRVLGIYTKYDGKWYIADEKGSKQIWKSNIDSGKYRVLARMIHRDTISGLWQDTDPTLSAWTTKSIYILVDASGIDDVYEKIVLDETDN